MLKCFLLLLQVNDLDLEKSLLTIPISHPSAQNRFLLHPQTSLLRLPSSPLSLLTTIHKPLTRALLLAIIKEPFQPKPSSPLSDESVDSFIRRRFGPYVADHMISAMVHGIYATDSRKLSVRSAFPWLWEAERRRGSVVKALIGGLGEKTAEEKRKEEEEARAWSDLGELGVKMKKGISVWGLEGGLGKLGDRFKEVLEKRGVEFLLEHKVESLESIQGGGIKVALPAKTFETPLVVSTLSASTLSKLLPSSSFLPHLAYNPSSTVSVVTLIFPSPPLSAPPYHPPGFGYLVPRSNQSNPHGVLGVIFDSSSMSAVDSIRTQSKIVKFTLMMGGPHYTSSNPPPSDPTTLIPIAVEHLRSSFPDLPKDLEPIAASAKTQVDCIPTYQPGHGARMRELHEAIETGEWRGKLAVAGASYGGVSLNDCCEAGATLAEGLFAGEEIVTGLEKFKTWECVYSNPFSLHSTRTLIASALMLAAPTPLALLHPDLPLRPSPLPSAPILPAPDNADRLAPSIHLPESLVASFPHPRPSTLLPLPNSSNNNKILGRSYPGSSPSSVTSSTLASP
jgi:oxygen-dependent protoporphyrinogen oxidase